MLIVITSLFSVIGEGGLRNNHTNNIPISLRNDTETNERRGRRRALIYFYLEYQDPSFLLKMNDRSLWVDSPLMSVVIRLNSLFHHCSCYGSPCVVKRPGPFDIDSYLVYTRPIIDDHRLLLLVELCIWYLDNRILYPLPSPKLVFFVSI